MQSCPALPLASKLTVRRSRNTMKNRGPQVRPPNKTKVIRAALFVFKHVVDGFVEHRNGTGNVRYEEGLPAVGGNKCRHELHKKSDGRSA